MTTNDYSCLFKQGDNVVALQIAKLIDWPKAENCKLWLPPIQRSIVWSNEQVINYWDSLLRGYPAGTMMVHSVGVNGSSRKGRNLENGMTSLVKEGDYQLFDGQQRMAAILLGLGKGEMKGDRKLWVDLGTKPNNSSGLRFQLRITSTGQPFGYEPDAPNQKLELRKRRTQWQYWREKRGRDVSPQDAFENAEGIDVIDAECAVPFDEVYHCLRENDTEGDISFLSKFDKALEEIVREFVKALKNALESEVIIQKLDSEKIVSKPEEYMRFFGRVGQGGTRLSDDELTYSMIKYHYPEVNDRMKDIMRDGGRLAGEVDLVLAALRVAKTMASWDNAKEWDVISRPGPAFVAKLKEKKEVEAEFKEMIGLDNRPSNLAAAVKSILDTLVYEAKTRPKGLPTMLLARLPSELVDVLILFDVKRHTSERLQTDEHETLRAFVLNWLLFIGDGGKAALRAFQHAWGRKDAMVTEKDLIVEYEKEGISRFLPRGELLSNLREQVKDGDHVLRAWAERFTAADNNEHQPGEALRVLSTNNELIKRALIWLQREYIVDEFPYYNPLSARDEDLPFDLDHLIPYDIFGFNWGNRWSRLDKEFWDDGKFRWQRWTVGNSLGNFRWLSAPDNRGRHEGELRRINGDLVDNPDDWNAIIPQDKNNQPWSKEKVTTFQRLIDLRTLDLYEKLLTGIDSILPPM
ncbi:MAG: DUF262 domain-containing protein [Syntrophobacteraceae bacterium]